jgi:hypothetical protein
MNIALVHDHHKQIHLDSVVSQMHEMGAPVIRAVWMECFGHWAALEGCHRIRAAYFLDVMPEIEEIDYDDLTDEERNIADDSYSATVIRFED